MLVVVRKPDTPCTGCGKMLWSSSSSRPASERRCRDCGWAGMKESKWHIPTPCSNCGETLVRHVSGNSNTGPMTCLSCRKTLGLVGSEARLALGITGTGRAPRVCPVCKASFIYTCSRQITCSKTCGFELLRWKGNEWPKSKVFFPDCETCGVTFSSRQKGGRDCSATCATWRQLPVGAFSSLIWGDCLHCGLVFPVKASGIKRKYCTKRCGTRAEKKRVKELGNRFVVSDGERVAIYRKHDWCCHLCGQKVWTDVSHDHPWRDTLDHIIPRSLSGTDDHENLAPAHRWCNTVRGASTKIVRIDPPPQLWDTPLFREKALEFA